MVRLRALLLGLVFFASLASSRAASLEELAMPEGEVVFYSSFNNERLVALRDAFQKKEATQGVKSAVCFLVMLLQSVELFGEALSLSLPAPSSANRPSSPMTLSPVPPFSRSLRACARPI